MFKKEENSNYISKEEVNKIYEYQKKSFDSKIEDQQKKIDDLVDYISARFGDDLEKSDITKKLKSIENDLKKIKVQYKKDIEESIDILKKQIDETNKDNIQSFNNVNEKNTEITNKYSELFTIYNTETDKITNELKENNNQIVELYDYVQNYIKSEQEYKSDIQKQFEDTDKKIGKINYMGLTGKFDKKLKEAKEDINVQIANTKKEIEALLNEAQKNSNENLINKLASISLDIESNKELLDKVDEKILDEITNINKNVNDNATGVEKLQNIVNRNNEKNQKDIVNLNTSITNLNQQIKTNSSTIKKIVNVINNNNEENSQKIIAFNTNIASLNEKIKNNENISKGLENIVKNNNIKAVEKMATLNTNIQAIQAELKEQIKGANNKNKNDIKDIKVVVDGINNSVNASIGSIEQDILSLREEIKNKLDNNSSTEDIESLRKDYNKYILKMDKELAKISNAIVSVQKKNSETNKNLQIKIKAYIDNKIASINNTENIDSIINKLNLSMAQKEKLQRAQMEQLLNKKLKEIQKENERILNKKIEEINNNMRNMNTYSNSKADYEITSYKASPKKKNMYEIIDEDQILKKSASSKNPLGATKQGKSQILKFFYDDEE